MVLGYIRDKTVLSGSKDMLVILFYHGAMHFQAHARDYARFSLVYSCVYSVGWSLVGRCGWSGL
jgi:hypothetical protein